MKVLFLAPDYDETNGWGRYATGVLAQIRRRLGHENVIAPDPKDIPSREPNMLSPLSALADEHRLRKDATDVDLIHAAAEPLAPLAMMLSMHMGKPYLITAHGTYADMRTYGWTTRWLYERAFRHACAIVCVSKYTEQLVRSHFPDAKTRVIPGGFIPPAAKRASDRPSDVRRILSVGALKRRKGFHNLVDAVGLLAQEGFHFRCDIVGDKEKAQGYVEELQKKTSDLGVADRISLLGRVSEEKLNDLYAQADLFVLPSEHVGTAFEGLGLVYLEALSHGLPVIGSHDSGAEDIITHGENGLLVRPGDARELADAIRLLFEDERKWKHMAEAARPSVERFRWDVVGEKLIELYRACPTF